MKRRLAKLLVFVILGALVNVAVAWGFAIWSGAVELQAEEGWRDIGDSPNRVVWILAFSFGVGTECIDVLVSHERSPMQPLRDQRHKDWEAVMPIWFGLHAAMEHQAAATPSADFIMYRASGWPLPALWNRCDMNFNRANATSIWVKGIPTNFPRQRLTWAEYPTNLPVHPTGLGFAINTVFYAVVLWLLIAAPFALRRRRRIKRGLCPKCAYDLRGSASQSCPECGATR